jgi:putative phosphoribosyl transferase
VTFFRNRTDAGRQLGARLTAYANRPDVIVLGLPRGGVPVAAEVGKALGVVFDVFMVRKLGVPGHEELAMGAIAEGGVSILNQELIRSLSIPDSLVDRVTVREQGELERRAQIFRGERPPPRVTGNIVILIDDGLATGASVEAAILALRGQEPARIVVAVPVGARETCERLSRVADEVVSVEMPEPFYAVGAWYDDFSQTTDDEVVTHLASPQER